MKRLPTIALQVAAVTLALTGGQKLEANAIIAIGNLTCVVGSLQFGTLACTGYGINPGDSQLALMVNGIQGVKTYLSSAIQDNETSVGAQTTTVTFTTSGVPGGSGGVASGANIPISYDFSLSTATGASLTGYTLTFDLQTGASSVFATTPQFSGSLSGSSASPSGSNSFSTDAAINNSATYTLTEVLTVNWTIPTVAATFLDVTIPQNSLDFNSAPAGVPEPATFLMIGAALAGLAVFTRNRGR